jgi:hypothetical protein
MDGWRLPAMGRMLQVRRNGKKPNPCFENRRHEWWSFARCNSLRQRTIGFDHCLHKGKCPELRWKGRLRAIRFRRELARTRRNRPRIGQKKGNLPFFVYFGKPF